MCSKNVHVYDKLTLSLDAFFTIPNTFFCYTDVGVSVGTCNVPYYNILILLVILCIFMSREIARNQTWFIILYIIIIYIIFFSYDDNIMI